MGRIYVPADTPERWRVLLAKPERQWVTGYSAKTLAYCWHAQPGLPTSVKVAFEASDLDLFKGLEMLIALPEYRVPLPPVAGRPSQNDLFVLAKASSGDLVAVTVEGKVNEAFGQPVAEWIKSATPGKQERLAFLCDCLGLDDADALTLRYQLLHRTVSALLEARRFNAPHALMLVHSFSQSDVWFEDYSAFVSQLGGKAKVNGLSPVGSRGGVDLYLAWVRGEGEFLLS